MGRLIDFVKKQLLKYEKFIKFCIVGGVNALLTIIIYNFCLYVLELNYIIAHTIAFLITVINGFYWNKNHVFKASSKSAQLKFFTLYGSTFLLGLFLLYVFVQLLDIHKTLAQFPVIAINTFINYTVSRYWVFREEKRV